MVVKKLGIGDDWPDELWFFGDRSGFQSRHEWLRAAMDYARARGFNALAVNRLMVQRRPLGTELAVELTEECRRKVRRVRRPPTVGPPRLGRG